MSHTLIYYQKASRRREPSSDRVLAVLDSLPHTVRSGERGDYHHVYANQATGVEFSLAYQDPRLADEEEADDHHFAGLEPVGLSAEVRYLRPSFFGLESMPWLAHVAGELDLLVLDPQVEEGSAAGPVVPEVAGLVESWDLANIRATHTLRSQEGIRMVSAPRSMLQAWWRYMMALPDLQERYPEGPPIPEPRLMQNERGEVTSLLVWPYPEAAVLPADAETLFLTRERRRFGLLRVVETGAISANDFFAAIRPGLRSIDEPYPHLVFAPEALDDAHRKATERLAVNTRFTYQPVNPARLTDVDLPADGMRR